MLADIAECYDKCAEPLVRFAASQVGWADAQDVVSYAVVRVLQHDGENPPTDLKAYLYRAVLNASADHHRATGRRRRRERKYVSLTAPLNHLRDPSPEPGVRDAILALSHQQRAVVHLTYWEDMTPGGIADRLGVSDGTVRRQLARARKRLRNALHQHPGGIS